MMLSQQALEQRIKDLKKLRKKHFTYDAWEDEKDQIEFAINELEIILGIRNINPMHTTILEWNELNPMTLERNRIDE